MKIRGEIRGSSLRVDWDFIIEAKGEEGLKRVEDRMAELGFPLKRVAEMVVKAPVTCKETKCMFKGDPYHEFLLTW